ncbi:DUF6340 family protein [Cytophagaceae bacterium ABcell3]|nr:DUF6340 family protein [Cytophagaceae bacterium ABcell3]
MSTSFKFTVLVVVLIYAGMMTSCKTSSIYIDKYLPAEVDLGRGMDTLIIIDRSKPPRSFGNVVEGVLTGGGQFVNGESAMEVLEGIFSGLYDSPRFNFRLVEDRLSGGGFTAFLGKAPEPMSWEEVVEICEEFEGDGLVVLEALYPDVNVRNYTKERKKKGKNGKTEVIIEYYAEETVDIDALFRVYDAKNKVIVDEHRFTHRMRWNAKGNSPTNAADRLIDRRAAVMETSRASGVSYARRIAPSPARVMRFYFRKSQRDPYIKEAHQRILEGDWEGAMDDWYYVFEMSNKKKTIGRAAYNLAVGYEVLGDLETAKEWANEAISLNNRKAKKYLHSLSIRMKNEERLRQQMGE